MPYQTLAGKLALDAALNTRLPLSYKINPSIFAMLIDCRSALFMPASNARALAKGPTLAADVVIVDLEDAVVHEQKPVARAQAVQALQQGDYGYRLRALRINNADTPWYMDDIAAAALCVPDIIVLPKVELVDDIARLSTAMDEYPALNATAIWAMMESTLAVINANAIAASVATYPRLSMFVIGNNDISRAAGMPVQSDRTYLIPWLMTLVAAAKAYDVQVLDGVYNDFADIAGFKAECEQAVLMGMNGKTLIHPSQLAISNAVFSPSASDIENAQSIVDAFSLQDNADKGAIAINGRMVERLHLDMAQALLQRAQRLSTRM